MGVCSDKFAPPSEKLQDSLQSEPSDRVVPFNRPLSDFFRKGYLEGQLYQGHNYQLQRSSEIGLPVFLHPGSGIRVLAEVVDFRAAAPGAATRLLYHYTGFDRAAKLADRSRSLPELFEIFKDEESQFGWGIVACQNEPHIFHSKEEVRINLFWPHSGDPAKKDDPEDPASRWDRGLTKAGPEHSSNLPVCEAILADSRTKSRVDYCIPLLLPESFVYELWTRVAPDLLAEGINPGQNRWRDEQWSARDIWTFQLTDTGRQKLEEVPWQSSLEAVFSRRLFMLERSKGRNHADTLACLLDNAALLQSVGKNDEAEPILRRVVGMREASPESLRAERKLGELLREMGRAEAEPTLRRIAEGCEKAYGPGHRETLAALEELARLLHASKRLDEAATIYWQILERQDDKLGTLKQLAALLREQERPQEAEPLLRHLVEQLEQTHGRADRRPLQAALEHAALLKASGDKEEAEAKLRRIINICTSELRSDDEVCVTATVELAVLRHEMGFGSEAEVLLKQALDIRERTKGVLAEESLATAYSLTMLLKAQGRAPEAVTLMRRIQERSEMMFGPRHPSTLSACLDLGELLAMKTVGKKQEGIAFLRRCLAGRTSELGSEHLQTLFAMFSLARVLKADSATWVEAESLLQRATSGLERSLGPMHPDSLAAACEHAEVLRTMGRTSDAEPLLRLATQGASSQAVSSGTGSNSFAKDEPALRKALQESEALLGPKHPDSLIAANALAQLLKAMGSHAEAERLHRRTLEGRRKALGPKHADTLQSLNNLATLLHAAGQLQEAEQLMRDAYEGKKEVLGGDHLSTLTSASNLAMLLKALGRYSEALLLLQDVVQTYVATLGSSHEHTLTAFNNQAMVLKAMGRYAEAEPLIRRALNGKISTLGPMHPSTLSSLGNMGLLMESMGRLEEAEPLLRKARHCKEVALGVNHPDTLTSGSSLATVLWKLSRHIEAETIFRQVIEGRETVLGSNHPDTLQALESLAKLLQDDAAGTYMITQRSAGVTASVERNSPLIGELAAGVRVNVLEVVNRTSDKRVRARLEQPPGWISLVNLTTGYRWAVKEADEFEARSGYDVFPGRNARWMRVSGIEQCKQVCKERQYGAFVVCEGKAYFRQEPMVQCRGNLVKKPLATTYLFHGREASGTQDAEKLLRQVLQGREKQLGRSNPATLTAYHELATVLQRKNTTLANEEAVRLLLHAAETRSKVLGPEHADTLQSCSTLASVHQAMGNLLDAVPLLKRIVEGREKELGLLHEQTLAACSELAIVYQAMGRHEEALPLYQRAVEGREALCGVNHPDTLQALSSLGMHLQLMGRLAEAEPVLRETVFGNEAVLGPTDPDTLMSMNSYGMLLKSMGRLQQAYALLMRALEGCQLKLGPQHPDTLTAQSSVAVLLQALGKHQDAEPMHNKVLRGREKVLGPTHPDTLTSLNNLAMLLKAMGRNNEALPLVQRSLDGCEKTLGHSHPDSLTTLSNMGMLQKAMGKNKDAEPTLRRVLAIRISTLGPSNPATLQSINNLASVLDAQGKFEEAEQHHRRALRARQEVLGNHHPDTLNSLNNLAMLLIKRRLNEEAAPLLQGALAGCKQVLGPSHPDTVKTAKNLAVLLDALGRKPEAEALRQRLSLEACDKDLFHDFGEVDRKESPKSLHWVCLPVPRPEAVFIPDPRVGRLGKEAGIVAFSYRGKEEVWDSMCGAGFLSNHYDLGPAGMKLHAPSRRGLDVTFRSAEVAFQSLKHWTMAEELSELRVASALKKIEKTKTKSKDKTAYGGYGTAWAGMVAVLKAKFKAGSPCAESLMKTGDTFLLLHQTETAGVDQLWSDNRTGEGPNHLGILLMLLRDHLAGTGSWTRYIEGLIDPNSGRALGKHQAAQWKETVSRAAGAVEETVNASANVESSLLNSPRQNTDDTTHVPTDGSKVSDPSRQTVENGAGL